MPDSMYQWRRMSDERRVAILKERQRERRPWHSPPHYESTETTYYLITAACYEHHSHIGHTSVRMAKFEHDLINVLEQASDEVFAWVVLPNHYHALVSTESVKALIKSLGQLHGRSSYAWNGEDNERGRKVWCNSAETAIKSERHYFATLNYILNNAVHHGYVSSWSDWPYSNAADYLASTGRKQATEIWQAYPILDYGKHWDPPDL